jgi:hypothetical protein
MYENRRTAPLTRAAFLVRVLRHCLLAILLLALSLWLGMAGYSHYEGLAWRDAFLNASMLLGGMGPVNNPVTPAGKLFAGGTRCTPAWYSW